MDLETVGCLNVIMFVLEEEEPVASVVCLLEREHTNIHHPSSKTHQYLPYSYRISTPTIHLFRPAQHLCWIQKIRKNPNQNSERRIRVDPPIVHHTNEEQTVGFVVEGFVVDGIQQNPPAERTVGLAPILHATLCPDDKVAAVPPHTLILGTYPSLTSLAEQQYYGHPMNAFWWIAGDCLGFRRASGLSPSTVNGTNVPVYRTSRLRRPRDSILRKATRINDPSWVLFIGYCRELRTTTIGE